MTNEESIQQTIDDLNKKLMDEWHFNRSDQTQLCSALESFRKLVMSKYVERKAKHG